MNFKTVQLLNFMKHDPITNTIFANIFMTFGLDLARNLRNLFNLEVVKFQMDQSLGSMILTIGPS